VIFRSVHARRGENWRQLPGDELVPECRGSLTHAISIRVPRRDVWPWLVQMGAGRAGWYSYDWIDNGGRASADRLLPELQQVRVGDVFPAMPGVTAGFVVLQYETERYLVLGWLTPAGIPVVTWAFVLEELGLKGTRLIVRARAGADYQPPFGLPHWSLKTLVPLGHAIMQRKQLLGIAGRAESRPVWKKASRWLQPPLQPSMQDWSTVGR
jgi:hypothetical protein